MVQNLKVDIIYHLTPSDFEMEFNLCGCCRMRLLNDKTTDKKSFVKALARGVSRSRVIIACGPLFGADGIINIVATAIGNGVSICDSKTYGIKSDEEIKIINGSTPLVTDDGYFGGCIIESGPQTIILLTENKAFRKNIMQNLIHPYVEEISYIPSGVTAAIPTPEPLPTQPSFDEQYITEVEEDYNPEPIENIVDMEAVAQHNIEFIMDEETENTAEEEIDVPEVFDQAFDKMYVEVESEKDITSRYKEPYTPSESDSMFIAEPIYDEEEQYYKKKNNLQAMNITIVILVLLLLLSILALVYFVVLKPMTMGISTGEYIKEIFGITTSTLV